MIFNIGWLALTFVWLSGFLMGRGVASLYSGGEFAPIYITVSLMILGGIALHVRHTT